MQFGTIFENSICWNICRCGLTITKGTASLRIDAEPVPHLLHEEPVAHANRGLEGELLTLVQLGRGQLAVVLLQRQHAERDVARLVAHHVTQQLLQQRLGRQLVDEPEGGERETLDHDLHAEVRHVPAAVLDDVVEQQPKVRVDRIVAGQLGVEVSGEHLDVAGLVHHLRRRVVLGVDPRHRFHDLGRAQQRALLAVHELRQLPVLRSRRRA